MSFISILNSYKSQIDISVTRYSCMSHSIPTATISSVKTELDFVRDSIKNGIDTFFDDPSITNGSKLNFLSLSGLGNSFKNLQEWSSSEDSFYDRPSFSEIPFLFYKLGSIGTDGLFLNEYQEYISNISILMMNYQSLYDSFSFVTSKIDEFWAAYGTQFNTDVLANITPFSSVKTDFNTLPGLVNSFKTTGISANMNISIGQIFIQARETEQNNEYLSEIFQKYDTSGLAIYNTDISSIYGIHMTSVSESINSINYSESNLSDIQKSNILLGYSFFSIANSIHNTIQLLISKYS